MKILKKRPAFTLIEMLLYIGISSVVFVVVLRVMMSVLESRQRITSATEVQQSLRVVLNRMNDVSMNATGINVGTSVFGSVAGTLSFSMSGSTVNPIVFSLSGSRITIKTGSQPAIVVTSPKTKVDILRFTNLTPVSGVPVVRVEMHATQSGSLVVGGTQAMTVDTSLMIRR